ncbi:MAG: AMP-binding protein [Acidimicrobiia bacterium]|nr:AMP-binding protein [Acidimicrobiia bacterium]MDH3398626.1 AMP-binding protein [Acidimicrobiia bacterium]
MHDWLAVRAAQDPSRLCLVADSHRVSFAELDEQVARAAGALVKFGVKDGSRVAVWGAHDLATVRAMWAVPRAGAVLLPINTRLTKREASHQVIDAAVSLVLGHGDQPALGVPSLDLGEVADGVPYRAGPPHADSPHSIVYTSGSSGNPKGVILTWANLEAAAGASAEVLEHGRKDVWLAVMPLYHVGGMSILIRSARQGGAVVLDPFEPNRVATHLREGGITLVSLVPTMLARVMDVDPGPFPDLRAVLLGAGPAPDSLLARAAAGRVPVLSTYGLTEAASQVATVPLAAALARHKVVKPVPGMEVRIVDERSEEVPPSTSGSIQIRGAAVSPGYLHDRERLPGTWFTTGDLGRMDADHNLEVLGRADDTIITGGEKVHPVEVEAAIQDHPEVVEVAVHGVEDPDWGQVVAATVVAPGVDGQSLDQFLRSRLAGFKVPTRWNFVSSIARTSLGKIDRSRLRLPD